MYISQKFLVANSATTCGKRNQHRGKLNLDGGEGCNFQPLPRPPWRDEGLEIEFSQYWSVI